jgi:hypothetical protein
MRWEKKGLIYCPDGHIEWQYQFAILPTPLLINEMTLRIFLGFCDAGMRGRIGYVDVHPKNPSEIVSVSPNPVLDVGRPGCFDDNGVVPISILRVNGKVYLYYIGFQLGIQVPYYMFCGLAVSTDNGNSFERYSDVPVLDRRDNDLYARCGCFVMHDADDGLFKMWYVGSHGKGWTKNDSGKMLPLYMMKYISSSDGIHWDTEPPLNCLEYATADEHGFGRPYVFKENGVYKMYYSIRTYSRGYYIGYAESTDGIKWKRMDDQTGITTSANGWDSQNLSYPVLFHKGKIFMFYNGNGCGKTGFGYAELDK